MINKSVDCARFVAAKRCACQLVLAWRRFFISMKQVSWEKPCQIQILTLRVSEGCKQNATHQATGCVSVREAQHVACHWRYPTSLREGGGLKLVQGCNRCRHVQVLCLRREFDGNRHAFALHCCPLTLLEAACSNLDLTLLNPPFT
jgi:hypothetical protein